MPLSVVLAQAKLFHSSSLAHALCADIWRTPAVLKEAEFLGVQIFQLKYTLCAHDIQWSEKYCAEFLFTYFFSFIHDPRCNCKQLVYRGIKDLQ